MRELKRSDNNKLTIGDTRSGSEIILFYRNPTTDEEVAYRKEIYINDGKKVVYEPWGARLKFGQVIITGFREGDFGIDGKPIASDPASPNYYADWKQLITDTASDLLMALSTAVFEGVLLAPSGDKGNP